MADVHSLNQTGTVEEAVGYTAEAVDKGAQKVVVVIVDAEGRIEGRGFGAVGVPDLALIGCYLQTRAMGMVDA